MIFREEITISSEKHTKQINWMVKMLGSGCKSVWYI